MRRGANRGHSLLIEQSVGSKYTSLMDEGSQNKETWRFRANVCLLVRGDSDTGQDCSSSFLNENPSSPENSAGLDNRSSFARAKISSPTSQCDFTSTFDRAKCTFVEKSPLSFQRRSDLPELLYSPVTICTFIYCPKVSAKRSAAELKKKLKKCLRRTSYQSVSDYSSCHTQNSSTYMFL